MLIVKAFYSIMAMLVYVYISLFFGIVLFPQARISLGPVRQNNARPTTYWCMCVIVCTGASCMTQKALLPRRDLTHCYNPWLIR